MKQIGCIIMASGLGRRFGGNKLLAEFDKKPMIQHILEQTETLFPRRVVVTRYEEIGAICRQRKIPYVVHSLPGRDDTVRLGLAFFQQNSTMRDHITSCRTVPARNTLPATDRAEHPADPWLKGYLFCPADQPLLTCESLKKMALEFAGCHERGAILRLSYGEKTGAPVLFDACYAEELKNLPEKKGGSYLIRKYPGQVKNVAAATPAELMDVDTVEDLEILTGILNSLNACL